MIFKSYFPHFSLAILTGTWSEVAARDAEVFGKVNRVLPPLAKGQTVPDVSAWKLSENASYFYYCANETVEGTGSFNLTFEVEKKIRMIEMICCSTCRIWIAIRTANNQCSYRLRYVIQYFDQKSWCVESKWTSRFFSLRLVYEICPTFTLQASTIISNNLICCVSVWYHLFWCSKKYWSSRNSSGHCSRRFNRLQETQLPRILGLLRYFIVEFFIEYASNFCVRNQN